MNDIVEHIICAEGSSHLCPIYSGRSSMNIPRQPQRDANLGLRMIITGIRC